MLLYALFSMSRDEGAFRFSFGMPDRKKYRAAIHGYLGGQAGAGAMVDAIIGKANPSGKLNETWPVQLSDNPSYPYYPSKERTSEHREGLYVGYRYYDTTGKVRSCFATETRHQIY